MAIFNSYVKLPEGKHQTYLDMANTWIHMANMPINDSDAKKY